MKIIPSLIIILAVFSFSCEKGDPPIPCNSFTIRSIFIDSISYSDITGDTINTIVKYIKDSIKYEVISTNINIGLSSPIISKETSNIYSTGLINLSNISNGEDIYLIFHLDPITNDTITINIKNKVELSIYNKQKLLSYSIQQCNKLVYIKR